MIVDHITMLITQTVVVLHVMHVLMLHSPLTLCIYLYIKGSLWQSMSSLHLIPDLSWLHPAQQAVCLQHNANTHIDAFVKRQSQS